jgi:ribosomal protein S18 acetylase RimI-like enzyme
MHLAAPEPDHRAEGSPTPAGPLTIRLALPVDAPAIAALHARTWQWAYKGIIPADYLAALNERVEQRARWWDEQLAAPDPAVRVWVALLVDRLVGFCGTGPSRDDDALPGTAEVRSIYLDPSATGRAIGRALFTHAVNDLRAQGYRAATLWVLEQNRRARRFYEAAGWQPDGAAKHDQRPGFVLREVRYRVAL